MKEHSDINAFMERLVEALGLNSDDVVGIYKPQFERTDGIVPALPDAWERIRALDFAVLESIGCRAWEAPDEQGNVLMLFPKEWYEHIPAGFMVEDIFGEVEPFAPGETGNDYRFGCLSYGVRVAFNAERQA